MTFARAVAAVVVAAAACGPARTPDGPGTSGARAADRRPAEPPPITLQLPGTVRPTAYRLDLAIDPTERAFSGTVVIDVDVLEPQSTIWLHGEKLAVERATVRVGDTTVEARAIAGPEGSELLGIDVGVAIGPGPARLSIAFDGDFGSQVGAFRQAWKSTWYAYTDFEATDARRAFPCFDEPRYKVPWTVALTVPAGQQAFSNMPEVARSRVDRGRMRVQFAPTPPLPSYLIAFAVGPFDIVEGAREPTPVRLLVPRGERASAAYAVDAVPPLMRLLEAYFDMPVPYPKLDFVVVPRMSGAMENPGLITIGAQIALLAPDAAVVRQRLLTMVIAHELAHLWFGDLVTPAWWDDLWLNEGFATWMADKAVAEHQPLWQWELEAFDAMGDAMDVDSSPDARAIRQPIRQPDDVRELFSPITYKKAGAVLGMFEAWLGADAFRAGVRAYVRKHAEGSAVASDLIAALSAAAGRDVAAVFDSFLSQPGVPQLDVALECDAGTARVMVAQTRYTRLGEPAPVDDNGAWRIPVCVRHEHGRDCGVLADARGSISLAAESCPQWFHPNADEAGYYRYHYAGDGLAIAARRGGAALAEVERAGLVANARAGLTSGRLDVPAAMAALEALAPISGPDVLSDIVAGLRDIGWNALPPRGRGNFAAVVVRLFGTRARQLGFAAAAGDTDSDLRARPLLVGLVADEGGDIRLRADARRRADSWLASPTAIASDELRLILAVAALDGDVALANRYIAALDAVSDDGRRDAVLFGLARFARPKVLGHVLAKAFDELGVGSRLTLLRYAVQNPRTRDSAFEFFRDGIADIAGGLRADLHPLLPLFTVDLCTPEARRDVAALFETRPANPELLRGALTAMDRCTAFRARHETAAAAYMATAAGN